MLISNSSGGKDSITMGHCTRSLAGHGDKQERCPPPHQTPSEERAGSTRTGWGEPFDARAAALSHCSPVSASRTTETKEGQVANPIPGGAMPRTYILQAHNL